VHGASSAQSGRGEEDDDDEIEWLD
jgi:hypothetical protein